MPLAVPANIWGMSEHDSFEDRLRAIADQISQSVQRMSEVDLDEVGERYGIDAERARAFADAAGQWLSHGMSSGEPLLARTGTMIATVR